MTNKSQGSQGSKESCGTGEFKTTRKAAVEANKKLKRFAKKAKKVPYDNDYSDDEDFDLEIETKKNDQQQLNLDNLACSQQLGDQEESLDNFVNSSNGNFQCCPSGQKSDNKQRRKQSLKTNTVGLHAEPEYVTLGNVQDEIKVLNLPQKRRRRAPSQSRKRAKKNQIAELLQDDNAEKETQISMKPTQRRKQGQNNEISGVLEDKDSKKEIRNQRRREARRRKAQQSEISEDEDSEDEIKQSSTSYNVKAEPALLPQLWDQIQNVDNQGVDLQEEVWLKESDLCKEYSNVLEQIKQDEQQVKQEIQSHEEIQQQKQLLQGLEEILQDSLKQRDYQTSYAEKNMITEEEEEEDAEEDAEEEEEEEDELVMQPRDEDGFDGGAQKNDNTQGEVEDIPSSFTLPYTNSSEDPKALIGPQPQYRQHKYRVWFTLQQAETRIELNQICKIPGLLKSKTQRQIFLGQNWPSRFFHSQRKTLVNKIKCVKKFLLNYEKLKKFAENPPNFIYVNKLEHGSRRLSKRMSNSKIRKQHLRLYDKNRQILEQKEQKLQKLGDVLSKMGVFFTNSQQIDLKCLENQIKSKSGGEHFWKKFRSLLVNKNFMLKVKQQQLQKMKAVTDQRKQVQKQAQEEHAKMIAEKNMSKYKVVIKEGNSLEMMRRKIRRARQLGVKPEYTENISDHIQKEIMSVAALRWAREQLIDVKQFQKTLIREQKHGNFEGRALFPTPWMCVNVLVDVQEKSGRKITRLMLCSYFNRFLMHKCAKCGIKRLKLAKNLLNLNSLLRKQLDAICEGHQARRQEIHIHIQHTLQYSQHDINQFDPEKVKEDTEDVIQDQARKELNLDQEIDRIQQQKEVKIHMENIVSKLKTCLSRLWGHPDYCPLYAPAKQQDDESEEEEEQEQINEELRVEEEEEEQQQQEEEGVSAQQEEEDGEAQDEEEEEIVQPSQSEYYDEFAELEQDTQPDTEFDEIVENYKHRYAKWVDYPHADPEWRDSDTDLLEHSHKELQLDDILPQKTSKKRKKGVDEEEWCRRWEEVHRCAAEQGAYLAFCLTNQLISRITIDFCEQAQQLNQLEIPAVVWERGFFSRIQCPICAELFPLSSIWKKQHRCQINNKLYSCYHTVQLLQQCSPPEILTGDMSTFQMRDGVRVFRPKALKTPLSSNTRYVIAGNGDEFVKRGAHVQAWHQKCSVQFSYADIRKQGVDKWWNEPIKFRPPESFGDVTVPIITQGNTVGRGFIPYKLYVKEQQAHKTEEVEKIEEDEELRDNDDNPLDQTIDAADNDKNAMSETFSQQAYESQGIETQNISRDGQYDEEEEDFNMQGEEEYVGQQERELVQLVGSMPKTLQSVIFASTGLGLRTNQMIRCVKRIKYILGLQ